MKTTGLIIFSVIMIGLVMSGCSNTSNYSAKKSSNFEGSNRSFRDGRYNPNFDAERFKNLTDEERQKIISERGNRSGVRGNLSDEGGREFMEKRRNIDR